VKSPGFSHRLIFPAFVGLGVGLIVLTRWALIAGESGAPDGDECVVGLMAKHWVERGEIPVFFWGQRYGFSLIEAGIAAAFFKLFGVSVAALKAATVVLWTGGWLLMVLAMRRWVGTRAACIAAILVALAPAWAIWSTKARGGYVTGFALTSLAWLIAARIYYERRTLPISCALLGAVTAVCYFCHPGWLLAVAPLVCWLLYRRRRAGEVALVAGALVPVAGVLFVLAQRQLASWAPPVFAAPAGLHALPYIPYRAWVNLSGAYYYYERLPAGVFTITAATLWAIAVVFALVLLVRRPRGVTARGLARVVAVGLLAVLATNLAVTINWYAFRYLLPLAGLAVVPVSIVVGRCLRRDVQRATCMPPLPPRERVGVRVEGNGSCMRRPASIRETKAFPGPLRRGAAGVCLLAFVVFGALSFQELRKLSYAGSVPVPDVTNMQALKDLADGLVTRGYRHVYSTGSTLQWTLMFVSREQIVARWQKLDERVPGLPRAVDAALFAGERVALVGRITEWETLAVHLERQGFPAMPVYTIRGHYFVLPDPPVEVIRALNYELAP